MLLSVCVRELAQRETFCNTKPTCQHSTLHTQSISIELMRRYRKKKKKKTWKIVYLRWEEKNCRLSLLEMTKNSRQIKTDSKFKGCVVLQRNT